MRFNGVIQAAIALDQGPLKGFLPQVVKSSQSEPRDVPSIFDGLEIEGKLTLLQSFWAL
jgi:hypothetical protein